MPWLWQVAQASSPLGAVLASMCAICAASVWQPLQAIFQLRAA